MISHTDSILGLVRYRNIMQENNLDADVFHVNGVKGHKFGAESDNKNLIPFQRFY